MSYRGEDPKLKEGLTVEKSDSGADVSSVVSNSSNTASSTATHQVKVAGTSAGDPKVQLTVDGTTDWTMGIDNSDSDSLKIGPNAAVGTSTALTINTSGNTTLGGTLLLPTIGDSSDATKALDFTLSGATTAKTMTLASAHTDDRTLTLPDATGTLAERSAPIEASRLKEINDAAYTITDTDGFDVVYSSTTLTADRTVTLPTAADNTGRMITIKKADTGAYDLTVDGEGSETIDGSTTYVMSLQYEYIKVVCDGTGWQIVDQYIPTVQVLASRSTTQGSISNATQTLIQFDTETVDTHSAYDNSTNYEFTAPRAGRYQVDVHILYTPTAAAMEYRIDLRVNNSTGNAQASLQYAGKPGTSSIAMGGHAGKSLNLSKGDTLDVLTWQNSGGTRSLYGDTTVPRCTMLSIIFVGP